jgi:hypothetical protein
VNGLATFGSAEDVVIRQICADYRLRASAPRLDAVDSEPFKVSAGTNLAVATVGLNTTPETAELVLTYTITGALTVEPFLITYGLKRAAASVLPLDQTIGYTYVDATADRTPGTHTRSLGNAEGQYNGPDGLMYLSFQRAEDFGANLARNRFRAQITGTRPRPDLVEIAQRNPLLQGKVSATSAADVEFRLADGRIGVLTLSTFGAMVGNVGGSWWVDGIHGFIAPVDRAGLAAGAMVRLLTSGRENPQWAAGEREHQTRMGQQFQSYLNWSRNLQQQAIEQRWLADEARQRGMRGILGGTVRLQDPTTGETFEASASERYYFRVKGADRPTAFGTDTDFKPVTDLDVTRLLKIGTEVPDR